MWTLNPRPQWNNARVTTETHAGFPPSERRQSFSIIRYGGFLGKFAPRIPRRSLEPRDMISSRPRPASTQSISSLAAATLIGLAQTQRMSPLSEAAGSSLKSILALTRGGLLTSSVPPDQEQPPSEQAHLIVQASDETRDRSMNHHDHSDLSPPMSILILPATPFDHEEQGNLTNSPSHHAVPLADSVMGPPSLDSVPAISELPRAGLNALGLSLNEASGNAHATAIHQRMRTRPFIRPPSHAGPISIIHNNRRFLGGQLRRSTSSLLTATSFVTAPTGASPPNSIQSILRCDSPGPLPDIHRRSRVISFQASSLREWIAADDSHHDRQSNGSPISEKSRSPSYDASPTSNFPFASRKILIIGSSYKDHAEVKSMFSIETLDGALEDRDQLKTVFKERSYSVQTLFEEGFNKQSALTRVARFLDDAESGDVRAIVFTGHGIKGEDGTVSLVPPECPKADEVITRSEWDQNIKDHSRPGVVVFSIMAHCYSSELMKQEFDHRTGEAPTPTDHGSKDEPVFLTFAASNKSAYESWVTRDSDTQPFRTCDHFVHALAGAIQSIDVARTTWQDFFQAFDWYFQRARSCASWQDKQGPTTVPNWRLSNQQSPRFSASGFVRLSVLF